jgi:ribosomal protein L35
MPKIKTNKTLLKRIKITKTGKIMKKHISIGHLRSKWSADRKFNKLSSFEQTDKGHKVLFKRMLSKYAKNIKVK